LLGGRFVEMTPASSNEHQRAAGQVGFRLRVHLQKTRGSVVRDAPFDVYLDAFNVVRPDVLVPLSPLGDRLGADGVHGAPDLVVEVLSKSTALRDVSEKRKAYRAAGVPEYWIVDPDAKAVHVYRLQETRDRTSFIGSSPLKSPLLPGFETVVADFFVD
jgi:Uma2 family endonuclease